MVRVRVTWRRNCIVLLTVILTFSVLCLLFIHKDELTKTSNSGYSVILVPLKDSLDRQTLPKLVNSVPLKDSLDRQTLPKLVNIVSLKDSLDRQKLSNTLVNDKLAAIQNGSVVKLALNVAQQSKQEVVVQIDKHMLTMIEEIERSDTTTKGVVKLEGVGNYTCPQKQRVVNKVEDLLCMTPPRFLPDYKNPCWNSSAGKFQCLPYFQIIGMDKSGSTDLFAKIVKHPDVLKNGGKLQKETMWWSWTRYARRATVHGEECNSFDCCPSVPEIPINGEFSHWLKRNVKLETFQRYLEYFATAAKTIQPQPEAGIITGDGTPMDIWDMSGWVSIPQNQGLKEPKVITPHLMRHVNPDVKLIVILRDPVERLFSDYFFLKLGKLTTQAFHDEVIRSIRTLHACTRKSTLRTCIYNRSLHMTSNARIHLGFYSVFLKDWLKVFPRDQFLILRTEDYSEHTSDQLQRAFSFLGLRNLPQAVIDRFANAKRRYVTLSKTKAGKMLEKTRMILDRLYIHYKMELADILKDQRFLWTQ